MGALDDKVVIGSMNRGGLQGAAFELDDRFTAYTRRRDRARAASTAARCSPGSASTTRAPSPTLEASARAVTELAEHRLMAMVEPFLSVRRRRPGRQPARPRQRPSSRSTSPSGLGASSAYTWLKLPVVDDLERVMEATTLPTLLLGGDPQGDPDDTYASWGQALDLPAVRGLVVGRALLFPPDGDVAAAVDIAAGLVHGSRP